jgi:Protein of unknown function (DUF3489)
MRIYIIGNDGITLCREPPATINDGEISLASKEELRAAPLSGKRLLQLWNALPGVDKRKKVGDRETLIDQLWSAVEALPDPDQQSDTKPPSKQEAVVAMLQRSEGATVDEVASAMGWQRHTVRGLFSGTLKKKLGLTLASTQEERGRCDRRSHARRGAGFPSTRVARRAVARAPGQGSRSARRLGSPSSNRASDDPITDRAAASSGIG